MFSKWRKVLTIFFFLIFNCDQGQPTTFKTSVTKMNDVNMTAHLNSPRVQQICKSRDSICKSNNTNLCSMRIVNGIEEYKDFENECYLFLSNMCDQPGQGIFLNLLILFITCLTRSN